MPQVWGIEESQKYLDSEAKLLNKLIQDFDLSVNEELKFDFSVSLNLCPLGGIVASLRKEVYMKRIRKGFIGV